MNVLIYTQSYYCRNSFVNSLIPKGIALYHAEHPDDLVEKLAAHKTDVAVLDVIQGDYDGIFNVVRAIKASENEDVKKIAIILIIGNIDRQSITAAVQAGVIGFIKSNASEDFIANYVAEIYQKVKGVPPERKFVRVSIDSANPNERIGIKFRSPVNSQMIIGLIKDISFGGMATELIGTFPPETLGVGLEIKEIQFILEGKDILIDGIVIAVQKNFCAFRFTNMALPVRETICHYIFEKMSGIN